MKYWFRITIAVCILLLSAFPPFAHHSADSSRALPPSQIDSVGTNTIVESPAPADTAQTSGSPDVLMADTAAQVVHSGPAFAALPAAASPDSLTRAALRDSLRAIKASLPQRYARYGQTPDSIFSIDALYPFHVFGADANGISDVCRFHPALISIPYSLASSLTRLLFFGLPGVQVSLLPSDGGAGTYPNQVAGADCVSPANVIQGSFSRPGSISYTRLPAALAYPHTLLMWENGLFDENSLDVRFARPLGRHVSIGVFSNYRYMERGKYSHRSGGIYDFYSGFFTDTSLIVRDGFNPLTRNHVSTGHVQWQAGKNATGYCTYSYMDMHDDIAYDIVVNASPELRWEERSLYAHRLSSGVTNLRLGMAGIGVQTFAKNDVLRTEPISDSTGLGALHRGERAAYGASAEPFLPLARDTTRIRYSFMRDDKVRFDGEKWKLITHETLVSHAHALSAGPLDLSLSGRIGYRWITIRDTLEKSPGLIWDVNCWTTLSRQKLGVFIRQDMQPLELPYDTILPLEPGAFMNKYRLYGMQSLLSFTWAGLYVGMVIADDVSGFKTAYYWPRGIVPYAPPGRVLTVAPLFGRWYGIAASSSWMFSNTKPYVKSHSTLSYQSPGRGNRQRLFIDMGFDYWSEREPILLGGIDIWHRPIYDLQCKITVQIRTFRLYYKINNLFDRRFAYIPGYYLPGLTFRWGFNWLLQG